MRGSRYCEVLLVDPGPSSPAARVYNTIGLHDRPAARVQSLDLAALKAEHRALEHLPNGSRF